MTDEQAKTILVADDEPYVLRSLEHILKKQGYRVLTAIDGQQALEAIRAERPDMAFLDIQMPRMNGNEVCRALRAEGASLHIVMVTAKGQESDRLRSLEYGADDYVTKPFSPRRILQKVREVLGE